jgi:hypothetical protein
MPLGRSKKVGGEMNGTQKLIYADGVHLLGETINIINKPN